MKTLYRIVTTWFVAGVLVDSMGVIIETAPILKWSKGKHINHLLAWNKIKNYQKL